MVRRASVGSGFSLAKQITKRLQLVIGDFKKKLLLVEGNTNSPSGPCITPSGILFLLPREDFSYSAIGAPGSPYGSQSRCCQGAAEWA